MRMFAYYICHSFVNQIRKLLKTWVLIFVVSCFALGMLLGVGMMQIENMAEDGKTPEQIQQEELEQQEPGLLERLEITPDQMMELVIGGVILGYFVFTAISADKNGSKIFLPADVNLLFPSPLKPQSVLLFRLATQLGVVLLTSIYVLLYMPPLLMDQGFTMWDICALAVSWVMGLAVGSLLQILLYTACSSHPSIKPYLRYFVFAFLGILGLTYFIYWKTVGGHYLTAAISLFNGRYTCLIPFWGWVKGITVYVVAGNLPAALGCLLACIAGGVGLAYGIWHIKADFYEDAMAKSQETAQKMEKLQSSKPVIVQRSKDRSSRLRREGMGHGWGENVFFVRALYNRFRFAHFHVFTKTSETYLAASLGVGLLCRFVIETDPLLPVVLTLTALVFFRALANPMQEDTELVYFTLIPESMWGKLIWSLLGGTANCLLDLIPGIIVTMFMTGAPLQVLAWLPVVVSMDFFSVTAATFINLSVPVAAGKMVKQMALVLFVYFGMLPDVGIMAAGIVTEHVALAALAATGVNIGLGLIFFYLSPLFLEPADIKPASLPRKEVDLRKAGGVFSQVAFGASLLLIFSTAFQVGIIWLLETYFPHVLENEVAAWTATFAPIYLIGVPAAFLGCRSVPVTPLEKKKLKLWDLVQLYAMCQFVMILGNLVAFAVTAGINALTDGTPVNPVAALIENEMTIPKILVLAVIGPVMEELVFRKMIIDRLHIYGGKLAVVTSALLFGLFHGNLAQLFYATGVGLILGYVYLSTGKLRYSAGLHMMINFLGGVALPALMSRMQGESEMGMWYGIYLAYLVLILILAGSGLVLVVLRNRKAVYPEAEQQLPGGSVFRTAYVNPGMLLMLLVCSALVVRTFLV